MPAPSKYSRRSGHPVIWARMRHGNYDPAGSYVPDGRWAVDSVTIGSREVKSNSAMRLNMAPILRGELPMPTMWQDALFAVGWVDDPTTSSPSGGVVLFEGVPADSNRRLSGGPNGEADTGDTKLQSAEVQWDGHPDSQVCGQYAPWIPGLGGPTADGKLVLDTSALTVFNPRGKPNRSVRTDTKTRSFLATECSGAHYFVAAGGQDILVDGSVVTTQGARYWTYAQAIAYLLARHCGAGVNEVIRRNYVDLWFGAPPAETPEDADDDRSTIWGACIGADRAAPLYELEAVGVSYDSADPEPSPIAFAPSTSQLLRAKVPGLDVTGMSCLDAIAKLLHAAGMGHWLDCLMDVRDVDVALPRPPPHTMRVWTPGGELTGEGETDRIGKVFLPRLEPHGTSIYDGSDVLRTAGDIIEKNTAQTVDAHWDYGNINNTPILLRGPTLYEITVELRPGWKILHSLDFGLFDNVNPATLIGTDSELQVAIGDGMLAFWPWQGNFEDIAGAGPAGSMLRALNMSQRLHAKGKYGDKFYEVGRKWILPTDWSYPHGAYTRDVAALGYPAGGIMPWHWGTYRPANLADAEEHPGETSFIDTPIVGAETWPARARPLLPCLVADASGRSIGIIVELSWESGAEGTWHPWTAFRVLEDECGIMLSYESPFDVVCPKRYTSDSSSELSAMNLFMSILHHTIRVRVTATIEGSDETTYRSTQGFQPDVSPRSRISVRRDRYSKQSVLSKHRDNWVRHPNDIQPMAAEILYDSKVFMFRPQDDTAAMDAESNRIRAMMGPERLSSSIGIPWIELEATPGCVVPRVDEGSPAQPPTTIARSLNFEQIVAAGVSIGPCVAGVTYTFGESVMTIIHLDDWRAPLAGAYA